MHSLRKTSKVTDIYIGAYRNPKHDIGGWGVVIIEDNKEDLSMCGGKLHGTLSDMVNDAVTSALGAVDTTKPVRLNISSDHSSEVSRSELIKHFDSCDCSNKEKVIKKIAGATEMARKMVLALIIDDSTISSSEVAEEAKREASIFAHDLQVLHCETFYARSTLPPLHKARQGEHCILCINEV